MRLWSIHPRHLDAKGLVALWREGLLARAVLSGATKGYRHHPQLARFERRADPVGCLDAYLSHVLAESVVRGYRFDAAKIDAGARARRQPVTSGQIAFEWKHLLGKLAKRDRGRWRSERTAEPVAHPCFVVVDGELEPWERR